MQPFIINDRLDLPTWSSAGRIGTRFLIEIRDNQRLMGLKCAGCGRVYVPPKMICPRCSREMDDWVEVGREGTVETYTVVHDQYSDVYQPKRVPYALGIIKLDGADTGLCHFVDEVDLSRLKIGSRVKAVFKENRKAGILDIDHFELVA